MMIISYFNFQKLMREKKRGVVGIKEDKGKNKVSHNPMSMN